MVPPAVKSSACSHVRVAPFFGGLLLASLLLMPGAAAADDRLAAALQGNWELNEDASDDIDDVLDDKLRKLPRTPPAIAREGGVGQRTSREMQQQAYWDTLARSRERRAKKNLRRLGTAYPLILAESVTIADDADGLRFTYDGELPRLVRPNPEGRVYTANGDELVVDTIGYTLSYWDGKVLVLETDPPNGGGRFVERVELSDGGRQLKYSVNLKLRVLTEPVTVHRVFDRAGA